MEWTCTKCGISVTGGALDLLGHMGWWITSPGLGLCPRCARGATFLNGEEAIRSARLMNRFARRPRSKSSRGGAKHLRSA
jgi:hypothetical protein